MKVMIAVTHLLGTGHLARALTLAGGFQTAGHRVAVLSGGAPVPHLDRADVPLVQLPSLRSDGVDFARLLGADGEPADTALLTERRRQMVAALNEMQPDVLITELFPFGRRILRAEFLALLEAARRLPDRPLICASIRDILAPPSKPQRAEETDAILTAHYDAVLVHADGATLPLERSWPVSDALRGRLHYTGFVAPPPAPPHPEALGDGEIIVSAGGGDVGAHVFAAARAAAALDGRVWRLLIGGADGAARAAEMAQGAPDNVRIEAARPEFRQMLHHAAASVSMCGYNTALDVLQSGCPAVFIPFDAGTEVEQSIRADALADLPGIAVVKSEALTPDALRAALHAVGHAAPRAPAIDGFDGASQTVRIVTKLRRQMR